MLKFGGKLPKLGKLTGALILAGLVQVALDAQDVLTGGAFSIQDSGVRTFWARYGRRHRDFFVCIAILMAESEPLIQACYSFVKEPCSAGLNYSSGRL